MSEARMRPCASSRPTGTRNRHFALMKLSALVAVLSLATVDHTAMSAVKPSARGSLSQAAEADREIIDFIDAQIRKGWEDNGIAPSDAADDAEWYRRVHLDIIGRIPDEEAVEDFLESRDRGKRSRVVENLLDRSEFADYFATQWTNLAIGRGTPQGVNRDKLTEYFREGFGSGKSWGEVVTELVTATGTADENGVVNYLLAQLAADREGIQATAATTRLFLGVQVQCTQCHNHPFNTSKQRQFWEFNSFFRQAQRTMGGDGQPAEVTDSNYAGHVDFELRSGLADVAFPKYFGKAIEAVPAGNASATGLNRDGAPGVNRRTALAQFMLNDPERPVAKAFVNRMWGHFFGYGFTRPVDDIGPHNQPTHPELLERLAAEFAQRQYNPKTLIRWICNSEAYHLTSRFSRNNEIDNPASGEAPLFSHMYLKSLEAEQLYESLIVATQAHKSGKFSDEGAKKQRDEWLSQFIVAFGTDENDESTTFNGTIPQALMMMNGPLIKSAVNCEPGSYLHTVFTGKQDDRKKVRTLYLATLGRPPSQREFKAAVQLFENAPDRLTAFQDLFWALLNSNEFILNH